MSKLALIWCAGEAGGLQRSLLDTFRSDRQHWDVLSPTDDDFLERAAHYDGYVISGSPSSVIDDAGHALVRNLLALIRQVHAQSAAPMLGVCFGSQAIAAALGGRVGRNPDGGFKLGAETLAWSAQADAARWPEAGAATVLAQSHGECVSALPPGSEVLATSPSAAHEIFLVQRRFLGVQGHPEVDNELLRQVFMPLHRPLFDAERWQQVEREAQQTLHPAPVIALGQRLLRQGFL
ncbi:MAG: gamma-glutamyl-gamma-aminobutyrate hydrolase family protein [Burkholderiales bacterium]|nr:gamma-glutamyl-gamma-aminobutyrate hydrolase family protein [Burkholderiales bacterium]